jgi:hypothetical protein
VGGLDSDILAKAVLAGQPAIQPGQLPMQESLSGLVSVTNDRLNQEFATDKRVGFVLIGSITCSQHLCTSGNALRLDSICFQ